MRPPAKRRKNMRRPAPMPGAAPRFNEAACKEAEKPGTLRVQIRQSKTLQ